MLERTLLKPANKNQRGPKQLCPPHPNSPLLFSTTNQKIIFQKERQRETSQSVGLGMFQLADCEKYRRRRIAKGRHREILQRGRRGTGSVERRVNGIAAVPSTRLLLIAPPAHPRRGPTHSGRGSWPLCVGLAATVRKTFSFSLSLSLNRISISKLSGLLKKSLDAEKILALLLCKVVE